MNNGYRVLYFANGRDLPDGLPDTLICDATLEANLERIRSAIHTWTEAGDPNGVAAQLSLTIIGPFPEDRCAVDRRTPEQKLAEAQSPDERLMALCELARARFEAGEYADARRYASEVYDSLPTLDNPWNANRYRAAAYIVLGRIAVKNGDIEQAKLHLIEAGRGDGSPTMNSFGPNMSLARDLLLIGEKQAVLDYFEACGKFWESGRDQMDEWALYVNAGRIPDFGGNLTY